MVTMKSIFIRVHIVSVQMNIVDKFLLLDCSFFKTLHSSLVPFYILKPTVQVMVNLSKTACLFTCLFFFNLTYFFLLSQLTQRNFCEMCCDDQNTVPLILFFFQNLVIIKPNPSTNFNSIQD